MEALAAAASPRLRAVIVNSPHNPTGRIYPPEALTALSALLEELSASGGRPVYLISDEAYSRIVFDGRSFPSPATYYSKSLLVYTYGKVLVTPGQRLGYIALHPGMPDAEQVSAALLMAQMVTGWAFPNALLQHALAVTPGDGHADPGHAHGVAQALLSAGGLRQVDLGNLVGVGFEGFPAGRLRHARLGYEATRIPPDLAHRHRGHD